MRFAHVLSALVVVGAMAASTPAQVVIQRHRSNSFAAPANPKALAALQQDLIAAIEDMKAALPIYDGDRVRSIHAAHAALVIVDTAIAGNKAAVRPNPNVKDGTPSGTAHTKYSPAQISDSQASMRKGYAELQQAWTDLQNAAGTNPNAKGKRVANHLQLAAAEATKAIALHAGQG